MAVNRVDISSLHHGDIVNLIKDSGYSVVLTVGPPIGNFFVHSDVFCILPRPFQLKFDELPTPVLLKSPLVKAKYSDTKGQIQSCAK